MDKPQLFSSKKNTWGTPKWLFDILNNHFSFSLDVCADYKNFKMVPYLGEYEFAINNVDSKFYDCLTTNWNRYGRSFFMNPPYGKNIKKFISKAVDTISQLDIDGLSCNYNDKICVMLLPSRTDTAWFHKLLNLSFSDIRFIKGRIYFEDENRNEFESPATFPSCLCFLNCKKYIVDECMNEINIYIRKRKILNNNISKDIKLIHVYV